VVVVVSLPLSVVVVVVAVVVVPSHPVVVVEISDWLSFSPNNV
jgi:hypothetical protein